MTRSYRLLPVLAAVLATASPVRAQFNITTSTISAKTLASGQAGTVTATGILTISGSTVAVTITGNNVVLTNNGTISQTGTGRVIRDNTGVTNLTVNNNAGALLQAADADVIQMNKSPASVTLNNAGTLTSLNASAGGSQAVDFNAILSGSNVINNFATGILQASEADAVRPGINGVVNNAGLIKAVTSTGSGSDGIDAQTNSGIIVTNSGTGLIEGGRHGITGGNLTGAGTYAMSVTNQAGATIQGDNGSGINIDGVGAAEIVTIVNNGTITGNGHDIGDSTGHDGDGVDVDGVVALTNTGTIKSLNAFGVGGVETSEGVTVGGGNITNSGTIEGDVASGNPTAIGRGITIAGIDKDVNGNAIPVQAMYAATTITNSGLIRGQSDSGIAFPSALASGFAVTIVNTATGTIEGGGNTAAAIQTGADNDTVINAGTIIADASGKAVDLGGGDDLLIIQGGAITGDLAGGTGSNTLAFTLGAGGTFSYSGGITQFDTVQVNSGTVTYSGSAAYTGATVVNGGTLTVTGALTGTSGVTVNPTGTFAYANNAVALDRAVTVSGGTFKYNSSQAFTGPLTLTAGVIGGSGNLGTTAMTIGSGVTLSPGDGVGTLATGAQTWAAGGNYRWEINALAGQGGIQGGTTGWDHSLIAGALNITATAGGKFTVTLAALSALSGWDGTANHSWTIASASGGITWLDGGAFNIDAGAFGDSNALDGGAFALSVSGNDLNLNFTAAAVPEPGTWAAFAGAATLVGAVLTRRRAKTAA